MTNQASEELKQKLRDTKTFNYNVYFGVIGGDNAVSFDEALDEIASLIRTEKLKLLDRIEQEQYGMYNDYHDLVDIVPMSAIQAERAKLN